MCAPNTSIHFERDRYLERNEKRKRNWEERAHIDDFDDSGDGGGGRRRYLLQNVDDYYSHTSDIHIYKQTISL